jgi:hypothetical protein
MGEEQSSRKGNIVRTKKGSLSAARKYEPHPLDIHNRNYHSSRHRHIELTVNKTFSGFKSR